MSEKDDIEKFIAEKGVTKCPPHTPSNVVMKSHLAGSMASRRTTWKSQYRRAAKKAFHPKS